MAIKTRRSKSYRRRHSRRKTRKNGGACPCSMRGQFGGRGGEAVGHVYTTGATQTLYQITGEPGRTKGGYKKRKQKNN